MNNIKFVLGVIAGTATLIFTVLLSYPTNTDLDARADSIRKEFNTKFQSCKDDSYHIRDELKYIRNNLDALKGIIIERLPSK